MINRLVIVITGVAAVILAGGGIMSMRRLATAQANSEQAIARLEARLTHTERRPAQNSPEPTATHPATTQSETAAPVPPAETATAPDVQPQPQERTEAASEPVLTNAMRDVVVTVDRCLLNSRTLRCSFTVTNQSSAEKKFILGVGGYYWSRFEESNGGATIFDDLGNDFLSVGGGVGNREQPNCDSGHACEVVKTLTPAVRTPGWLRFDNTNPEATVVKLLRLKWSDGESWVAMNFRNIAITRPPR